MLCCAHLHTLSALCPLQVSSQWGLSRSFLGFIVLPIAGNACEHITGACGCLGVLVWVWVCGMVSDHLSRMTHNDMCTCCNMPVLL